MNRPAELTRLTLREFPLPQVEDGDKDSKGRLLVIAGSRTVPGSALLTATAALRAGAGKLQIATVDSIAVAVALAIPEAMVVGLPEAENGGFAETAIDAIGEQAGKVDAVVAGPGMARAQSGAAIARALIAGRATVVLDAALLHSLKPPPSGEPAAERPPILLPHAGELASLLDCDRQEIESDPTGCGLRAAERYRANVLVKGATSHIVSADGRLWTWRGGAPGLGVSGSGDTLAGIIGGLLARGAEPLSALLWGVLLHGEAGAALDRRIGPVGFLAREIPGEIPALLAR